jgi:hypothetical protein
MNSNTGLSDTEGLVEPGEVGLEIKRLDRTPDRNNRIREGLILSQVFSFPHSLSFTLRWLTETQSNSLFHP